MAEIFILVVALETYCFGCIPRKIRPTSIFWVYVTKQILNFPTNQQVVWMRILCTGTLHGNGQLCISEWLWFNFKHSISTAYLLTGQDEQWRLDEVATLNLHSAWHFTRNGHVSCLKIIIPMKIRELMKQGLKFSARVCMVPSPGPTPAKSKYSPHDYFNIFMRCSRPISSWQIPP